MDCFEYQDRGVQDTAFENGYGDELNIRTRKLAGPDIFGRWRLGC